MHAPITEAADAEEKQQEEEDSMEGTHTVSAYTADTAWLTAVMQKVMQAYLMMVWINVTCACILQWAVKDLSTSREIKRFSPTFTIGGYPWYDSSA